MKCILRVSTLMYVLVEVAGRTDVPVGIGTRERTSGGRQSAWVRDYDLARYPGRIYRDGVQALIDAVLAAAEPITLICIGPMPNIRAALQREPRIAQRARFVGMYGSVRRGYDGKSTPDAEWNVKADPAACRAAFAAPWNITITPLDTCGIVKLRGAKYAAVRDCPDPVVRALMENYRIWSAEKRSNAESASSVLFDTVAVYLAISEELLRIEEVGLRITDDGRTVVDPSGRKVRCALEWTDLPSFEDFLVRRLTGK